MKPDFEFEDEQATFRFFNEKPIVLAMATNKDNPDYQGYGYAVCDDGDEFDFLTGMKIALSRLLCNSSRLTRKNCQDALVEVWSKYPEWISAKVMLPKPLDDIEFQYVDDPKIYKGRYSSALADIFLTTAPNYALLAVDKRRTKDVIHWRHVND